jgi:DegV family protein with EDD domain
MSMIKIVTDSTAYLSEDYVQEHDIRVVPLCVHFSDRDYKEGINLGYEEFYDRLKEASELPTTSQPSAGEFHEVFQALTEAGHEIVAITISSRLSGTWNSAMGAKDMLPEAEISVVDSLSTAIGLQLIVEAAVEAVESGASRQQVLDRIEEIKDKLLVLFVVDTLEYLAKGGRIGNAKAFLGTLLKVKPILVLQDGAIEPCEQVRSKSKAKARMLEIASEHLDGQARDAKVAITQALVPEEAAALAQQLQGMLGCSRPSIRPVGPVIGTHTGPGVIGVAVYA